MRRHGVFALGLWVLWQGLSIFGQTRGVAVLLVVVVEVQTRERSREKITLCVSMSPTQHPLFAMALKSQLFAQKIQKTQFSFFSPNKEATVNDLSECWCEDKLCDTYAKYLLKLWPPPNIEEFTFISGSMQRSEAAAQFGGKINCQAFFVKYWGFSPWVISGVLSDWGPKVSQNPSQISRDRKWGAPEFSFSTNNYGSGGGARPGR